MLRVTKLESGKARDCEEPTERLDQGPSREGSRGQQAL